MKGLTVLGGIVGFVVLMVLSSIFNGYALSVLWGWFVVPTLSAPALSLVPAIGISIVVSYLTYQHHNYVEKEQSFGTQVLYGTITAIIRPSLALLFGSIVHSFM